MQKYYKYIGVFIIGFIVSFILFKSCSEETTNTVTEERVVIRTVKDSTALKPIDTVFVTQKPVKIVVEKEVVKEVPIYITDSTAITTTKYVGQDTLTNGLVDYEIYADNLYATKFKLTTKDSTVYVTEKTTKKTIKSGLLYGGGIRLSGNGSAFRGANLGLQYNHKQKWAIDLSADYDAFVPQGESKLGVGLRLWLSF
tara:strand:- start:1713 stop:2306 length:594 start_codon:yes stop_codon:yes gene_type:complete